MFQEREREAKQKKEGKRTSVKCNHITMKVNLYLIYLIDSYTHS